MVLCFKTCGSSLRRLRCLFLIITTNHLEKIDEALGVITSGSGISTRPGRIDSVIELGHMEVEARLKLACKVLVDWPDMVNQVVNEGVGLTPVQFQELCIQHAYKKIHRNEIQEEEELK